jgi:hypothetical protein
MPGVDEQSVGASPRTTFGFVPPMRFEKVWAEQGRATLARAVSETREELMCFLAPTQSSRSRAHGRLT